MRLNPEPWTRDAACRDADPNIFFPVVPGRGYRMDIEPALVYCRVCPVMAECLAYVMSWENTGDREGVWGGTTPRQRKYLRKKYIEHLRMAV
jgi:WhiB family redox-sensing transcriptional regulator